MSRKVQSQFTAGKTGFIKKLKLCGGSLLLERATMHFGYRDRNGKRPRPEATHLLTWARQQPWLSVEAANACRGGRDCETWRIRLLESKLPAAIASNREAA
ncbi:MAG: hypothetical protein ACR2FS_17525 [Phormidesmis sp.]